MSDTELNNNKEEFKKVEKKAEPVDEKVSEPEVEKKDEGLPEKEEP